MPKIHIRQNKSSFRVRCKIAVGLGALLLCPMAQADYEAGVNAAFDGDYDTAFREFSAAAEEGLMLAQYNLGILYFTGRGVEADAEQAFRWTLAAAEQGHTAAQFNVASLFFTGEGVDRNPERGIQWYARAARAGHPQAAATLAQVYEEGDGVSADLVTAHAWASYAVLNEAAEAAAIRQSVEAKLDAEELAKARRLFARWRIQVDP